MKRNILFLLLLLCIGFTGIVQAQSRLLGTLVIAYGPPNKDAISIYYTYEVYGTNMFPVETVFDALMQETDKLKFKRREVYFMQPYPYAIKAFEATLSRKELKKKPWWHGGLCQTDGTGFDLLTPRHPQHDMHYSTADMSMFERTAPSSGNAAADDADNGEPGQTQACTACRGKGWVMQTDTHGGDIKSEEMDSKGNWRKVVVKRTGRSYTSKVNCSACNGSGRTAR